MGRNKSCTPDMRVKIINKYCKDGKSIREIADDLSCSKTMVHNAIQHYSANGTVSNIARAPRKKITTLKEDRIIVRMSKADPFLSSAQIRDAVAPQLTKEISSRTIRRRLFDAGLRGCIAKKKPLVTKKNLKRRIEFAKTHVDKPLDFWKKIVWSDETKVNMLGSDGKKYVRRPPNQELNPRYTLKTVKHGGGNVMVWGAFSWYGVGPVRRINTRMDQHLYKEILKDTMHPYLLTQMPEDSTFMHDNDPKHTARSVKAWLNECNINVLQWPAQSPDLNPIENLWADVQRALEKKTSTNSNNLFKNIEEVWNAIPVDRCRSLVESLPRRCQAVLKNKGYPTKY